MSGVAPCRDEGGRGVESPARGAASRCAAGRSGDAPRVTQDDGSACVQRAPAVTAQLGLHRVAEHRMDERQFGAWLQKLRTHEPISGVRGSQRVDARDCRSVCDGRPRPEDGRRLSKLSARLGKVGQPRRDAEARCRSTQLVHLLEQKARN